MEGAMAARTAFRRRSRGGGAGEQQVVSSRWGWRRGMEMQAEDGGTGWDQGQKGG